MKQLKPISLQVAKTHCIYIQEALRCEKGTIIEKGSTWQTILFKYRRKKIQACNSGCINTNVNNPIREQRVSNAGTLEENIRSFSDNLNANSPKLEEGGNGGVEGKEMGRESRIIPFEEIDLLTYWNSPPQYTRRTRTSSICQHDRRRGSKCYAINIAFFSICMVQKLRDLHIVCLFYIYERNLVKANSR